MTDLIVPRKEFQRIGFGFTNLGNYTELATTIPSFTGVNENYTMTFDVSLKFDSTKYLLPLVIRYVYPSGSFTDIDTSVYTISYPYKSATLFLTNSIHRLPDMHFQDVDRLGNKFFYHPLGGEGLFEYDLNSHQSRQLALYGSGDHIAADSNFVFMDIGGTTIWRYDLSRDTSRLLISFSGGDIRGMDTYLSNLYVLRLNAGALQLKKYTFDGVNIDSLEYSGIGYYLAINNNIMYSVLYSNGNQISRFDLGNKTFLSNLQSPVFNGDGIKFYNGFIYFVDFYKGIVGRMPAADLK